MGAMSSLATIGLNAMLSRGKARDQSRAIAAERDQRLAEVQASDAAARVQRARQLQELLARQKALAASAGSGGSGGSASAVLRGLQAKAATDDALAVQERELALRGIRTRASRQMRRNLLESNGQLVWQGWTGALDATRSLLDL